MNKVIRPTTIEGIKRYAKAIKKAQGIQHAKALDAASQAAGFDNYQHALRALSVAP